MNDRGLRDIHLPDSSLWWPPAPGWWLLLLLLLAIALATPWLIRRLRHKPLSRISMQELETIRLAHGRGQSQHDTVNQVARLLRRVLISYQGRAGYAASTGDAWLDELEQLAPQAGFSEQQLRLLARDRYQARLDCDVDALLRACERWIGNLPRDSDHVSA